MPPIRYDSVNDTPGNFILLFDCSHLRSGALHVCCSHDTCWRCHYLPPPTVCLEPFVPPITFVRYLLVTPLWAIILRFTFDTWCTLRCLRFVSITFFYTLRTVEAISGMEFHHVVPTTLLRSLPLFPTDYGAHYLLIFRLLRCSDPLMGHLFRCSLHHRILLYAFPTITFLPVEGAYRRSPFTCFPFYYRLHSISFCCLQISVHVSTYLRVHHYHDSFPFLPLIDLFRFSFRSAFSFFYRCFHLRSTITLFCLFYVHVYIPSLQNFHHLRSLILLHRFLRLLPLFLQFYRDYTGAFVSRFHTDGDSTVCSTGSLVVCYTYCLLPRSHVLVHY